MTTRTLYGWSTRKIDGDLFEAIVTRSMPRTTPNAEGRYADEEVIKREIFTTRAKASVFARRWVRFCRSLRGS